MYIASKDFIETLDNWLFKNEKKYANELKKHKNEIPDMFRNSSGFLYRGMIVSTMEARGILEKGIDLKDVTSWTHSEKVAESFVNDSRFKTTNKDGACLILKMKIPQKSIILDIFNYVLFSGGMGLDDMSRDSALKEQEVLVDSIKVPKNSITVLK